VPEFPFVLDDIPIYMCIYIYMCVYKPYTYICTYTHTHLFIHSSVNGHLGCFHLLLLFNAAMNAGAQTGLELSILLPWPPDAGITAVYHHAR
jgi:hypothetical protein